MATPADEVVEPSQPAQTDTLSPDTPVPAKVEEASLDLSRVPHAAAENAHVTNAATESTQDEHSNPNDGLNGGTVNGTDDDTSNNIGSSANESATEGSAARQVECETFANLEKVRFGGHETILEGVNIGLKTLDGLYDLLDGEAKGGNEAARWLTRFDKVKQKLKETRTVVGILGNTGAGKSTLINAILDEEDIIPTNCMRACTAVPTEIRYNHDEDTALSYRGEAEFITAEDWQKEVGMLLTELVDPAKRLSRDYLQPDTGAGIAYAKIKAVYPHLTNDNLAKSSVKDLIDDHAVKNVLGTVMSHARSKASDLKSDLRIYVDSAEKFASGVETDTNMAYWPLVKVVRIYLKSKVLSTGTVLVDLPGVQDSNAARSAVSERFRAECSSIWIVSPINRAVDDKAAKHLLGTSFKLQLTMDGSYSNITFICSKTDEIAIKEVADKLDVNGAIRSMWAKEEECARTASKLKAEMQELMEKREEIDDARDELEARRSKKRKHADDKEGGADAPDAGDGTLEEDTAHARKESVRIRKQLKALKARLSAVQKESHRLAVEAAAHCVEARNKYSMKAIRSDFADGVRETVEDADADSQAPRVNLPATEPDYDHIAHSLPVFCVSSRGYQSLMGRTKDKTIEGYRSLADTQIPQLQEHAMRLGDLELATTRKEFLADLARLYRSLLLWAASGRSPGDTRTETLTDDETLKISRLDNLIAALRTEMDTLIKTAVNEVTAKTKSDLLAPIAPMCVQASNSLPDVVSGWLTNPNSVGKPLRFPTYRSICISG